MKLEGYRETFYAFSEKASDLSRQLAFAAIAIIWLFKIDVEGSPTIPATLLLPGALVIAALAIDATQYLVASIIWRCFYRHYENKQTAEDVELTHSPWLERPITFLFFAKVGLIAWAYAELAIFAAQRLSVAA